MGSGVAAKPPVGVVIPAYNEEATIARCLATLLEDAEEGEFDVVVVANGCSDRTAEIAEAFRPRVRVLQTPVGCKTRALNDGDAALPAGTFPRIYLDGDLQLSTRAARTMCRAVCDGRRLAAAPRFRFDTSAASWAVRAYYAAWASLPYQAGRIAGAYALSEAGRRRFSAFPEVISDDGFVRLQFAPYERATLEDCEVTVAVPRHVSDLIRIKTRSRLGTLELRERFPELQRHENAGDRASGLQMLTNIGLWHCYAVYALVSLATRWRASIQRQKGEVRWERDESSRQPQRPPIVR